MKFKKSDRLSYLSPRCSVCMLEVAAKYLKLAHNISNSSSVNEIQEMQFLIQNLSKNFVPECSPNEIASQLFLYAAELGRSDDPWKFIRQESNKIALSLLPIARKDLQSVNNPRFRLYEAFKWAITGNNIDFGTAGHEVSLESENLLQIHENVKQEGFKIDDFNELWELLQEFKSCLYLCDNAGEIAFDMLVIEELIQLGVDVVAVVKGAPISNDAILTDAQEVGLNNVCKVITTGSPDLGFYPDGNSQEFIRILNSSNIVIAKGQANWESTYAYQDQLETRHFFNVLKIKCLVHAELLGFSIGSNLIYQIKREDFKKNKL